MHQKAYESSQTLDDKIESYHTLISETHSLPFSSFSDPSAARPGEILAVGRICSDSLPDGKLNPASILLESSRRVGNGARIPLRFDNLEVAPPASEGGGGMLSLFPGQIIAVRGVNPNGKFLSVKEILATPRLPPAATPRAALREMNARCPGGLRILAAAGPYTTHDNLDYEPLAELVRRARETRPDVLLLLGPFVDVTHPMVAEGDFELDGDGDGEAGEEVLGTLDDLFRQRVSRQIRLVDGTATMVILVPSTRDAVSPHVSFPQEAFSRRVLDLPKVLPPLGPPPPSLPPPPSHEKPR